MKDQYEEHACDFKNEAECEEELDDVGEGTSLEAEEEKHFGE
jgi:hypothetical protein